MRTFTDEELMAHADGELDASRAAELAAALQTDAMLAARYERFAGTRRVLKRAFAEADAEPVPEALLQRLAPPAPALRGRRAQRRRLVAFALAASVLIAIGLAGRGWWLARPDALSGALEQLASGETVATPQGEVLALSSLLLPDGQYCREYQQGGPQSGRHLACRSGGGHWQERAIVLAKPAAGSGYQPAGGDLDLAAALHARRLTPEEEQYCRANRWAQRASSPRE